MKKRDWTVLLLGGASATGKSSLARDLAHRLDLVWVDTDPIWLALQSAIPPVQQPDLHAFFREDTWSLGTEELVALYLRIAAFLSKCLEPVVAYYDQIEV